MNGNRYISLLASPPRPCAYLEGRESVSHWADPTVLDAGIYSSLIRQGFRRSGSHVYRPACPDCRACVAVRLAVEDFRPARRDRRCLRANEDVERRLMPARYEDEYFELYRRYLAARHPEGGMANPTPGDFEDFLIGRWSRTWFLEFRAGRRLLGVAVTDVVADGLSAVYSFFDPDESRRGLGNLAILAQIEEARRRSLPWLYLGYWIEACPKMAYKARFRPLQGFVEGEWRWLEGSGPTPSPAQGL